MATRDNPLAPYGRRSSLTPSDGLRSPFFRLREEMDRLFDDFFAPTTAMGGMAAFTPALDVTENDKQVCVRAELPGVEEKDIQISLDGDMLTVSGEKQEERSEEGEHRRLYERSYGSFERSIRLSFEPKDQDVQASFKNGVLTVMIPKPPELAKSAKRIPIAKM